MAYITLQEKIEALADSDETVILPIEMLVALAGGTPLAYIVDTAPYSAKDMLEVYTLENATGFFIEFRREREAIKRHCYITFRDVAKKVHCQIDESDFFNLDLLDNLWTKKYLPNLKPGDLAICAHPKVYLLKDLAELMEGGFERAKWDHIVPEGTLLTVLETSKIDKYPFVKVLYKGRIYWSFGALVNIDTLADVEHEHHYI